jgi:hypothetical protein
VIVTEAKAPALAAELAANVARLDEIRRKASSLFAGLAEAQLDWKPSPARWSVGECVLHMVETNRSYADALEAKIGELRRRGKVAAGPFRYGQISRWFVGMVEPPVKRRLPAPARFAPPRRPATREDVKALLASVDRIEQLNQAAEGLDLRAKIASPAMPLLRLEVGLALRMLGAHTLRHLLQAEAVTRESGFPAAVGNQGGRS